MTANTIALTINAVFWTVAAGLGFCMWKWNKPWPLTVYKVVVFFVLVILWGGFTYLPPSLTHIEARSLWSVGRGIMCVLFLIFAAFSLLVLWTLHKFMRFTAGRVLVAVAGVLVSSVMWDRPFYYFPGVSGTVTDSVTGSPVKDAVIDVYVREKLLGHEKPSLDGFRFSETLLTDSSGRYSMPPMVDLVLSPFIWIDVVDIDAVHVLSMQSTKRIHHLRFVSRNVDMELLSVKNYFEARKAKKALPSYLGSGRGAAVRRLVKVLLKNGVPMPVVDGYLGELDAVREAAGFSKMTGTKE